MSLTGYVGRLLDVQNKKSLFGWLFSWETAKAIQDGNLAHNTLFRGPTRGATLAGTDYFGNKYYEENEEAAYGRRRWVVFADKFDYNITSVPPEWHGWLNYVNDYNPTKHEFKKPIYHMDTYITRTGTLSCYNPKGSWHNPKPRNWRKYEAWNPQQSS
ncbi:hypothetical protein HYH03_003420 [Edaphochlamys debaryana]|uniref:NADH dehydrogenase [ubiquinone] 1 alpha subcomplex subunit 12 n=1 Tax=Edaphochlamys debaryana TaxID=47281 RepID=A0A835Y9V5_9CHLO|nr:hypothetical protein HYH03_003420 [Edaphochlamys debaryana]|eukprot:KAG2498676.1 hypothetical protein HYH03_003420 [Edaphochlamys debaryana]